MPRVRAHGPPASSDPSRDRHAPRLPPGPRLIQACYLATPLFFLVDVFLSFPTGGILVASFHAHQASILQNWDSQ